MIVAAGLFAAACGDDAAPEQSADDGAAPPDLTVPVPDAGDPATIDGAWVLTSGHLDGEPLDLVDGRDVTLTIDGDQVSGTAACNSYGGMLDTDDRLGGGGPFVVTDLSWTEMGCEPDVMQLEQRFLAALRAIDSYELAGSLHLGVTGVGTSLSFDPVAPVSTADIVGTTWVLDTVIEGDAASNSAIMSAAELTLADDGTLNGSTGCRSLEGEWDTVGGEIVFTTFAAVENPLAGVCAPESEALDGFIVGVLEGGFAAAVDGSRLTLTASDGDGLSYTAG